MDSMRVVSIRGGKGGADALGVTSAPRPVAEAGEILIAVRAAGINRPDLLQRQGLYPPPIGASTVLGLEVAGTVAAVGTGVSRWRQGDAVVALLAGGGYAEYARVDARHVLPIPTGMDYVHAAALPENVFTVWANVFESGQLTAGETVLIHGANSGIGVTAIQMAQASGAQVLATVRDATKARQVQAMGVRRAIDVSSEDWVAVVGQAGGADVILDMVGSDYFQSNLTSLKLDGRLVVIATLSGHRVELDLRALMLRRLTISASTLRARSADEKARLAAAVEAQVWPWVVAGKLQAIVNKTFPLEQAGAAHTWLESGANFGKVVLQL